MNISYSFKDFINFYNFNIEYNIMQEKYKEDVKWNKLKIPVIIKNTDIYAQKTITITIVSDKEVKLLELTPEVNVIYKKKKHKQ